MLEPQEIIRTRQKDKSDFENRRNIAGVIKAITADIKAFFSGLLQKTTKDITSNKYRVIVDNQIKLPDVQMIKGKVDIENFRPVLMGINENIKKIEALKKVVEAQTKELKPIKPEKVDFSRLEKAVKGIKIPETKIPKYPTKISVDNLVDIKKQLAEVEKAIKNIKIPKVDIPEYPKSISVKNLKDIKIPEPKEEEPLMGFYWDKDSNGNLTKLVEQYPSGEVISTGWALGRVKIDDRRN